MKLGRVIGRVVSTVKVESFEGLKLLLIQPLDEKLNSYGDAIVAVDTIQSGVGELIYYETSKEASRVIETVMNPCDAAIMGIVDEMDIEQKTNKSQISNSKLQNQKSETKNNKQ